MKFIEQFLQMDILTLTLIGLSVLLWAGFGLYLFIKALGNAPFIDMADDEGVM